MAIKDGRNGLRLDGGGGFVALLVHGFKDGRSQVQFVKSHEMCAIRGAWESACTVLCTEPVKGR